MRLSSRVCSVPSFPARRVSSGVTRPTGTLAISATKPFLLAHALDRGYSSALFLDADLWVLDGLGGLLQQVRSQPLTLSSHRSTPAATATEELRLLRAGTFNGGVVGVSAGRSRRFLDWWGSRVHADCRMAPEAGLHRWRPRPPTLAPATPWRT